MLRRLSVFALVSTSLVASRDAGAFRDPGYLTERPVELASGDGQLVRRSVARPLPRTASAWKLFTGAHGTWQGLWDTASGVPLRIWGEGIATAGANADPAIAESAARQLLAAQLALLAPGTKLEHWQLVTNQAHGPGGALRTVAFAQVVDGLPVLGGAVSFLWKHDRMIVMGSTARPDVAVPPPRGALATAAATARASAWLAAAYGATPTVRAVGPRVIVPLLAEPTDDRPTVTYRVARVITLDLAAPRGRWDVYVDDATGAPLARTQLLRFGTGTLRYDAPVRYPGGGRQDFPAVGAAITAGGSPVTTDAAGSFSFAGAGPVTVTATVAGPQLQVYDDSAPGGTTTLSVSDGGTARWSAPTVARTDALLAGFVHGGLIKTFARTVLAPGLPWLASPLTVIVNEGGDCNAYSDGDAIHFLQAGSGCENTGRLADVVYHEFGHSLHFNSVVGGAGEFDVALSEGMSDYLAATRTGDPAMGLGFLVDEPATPVRHVDPPGREYAWPGDIDPDPHATGLIVAGAFWDLRTALAARDGAPGVAVADALYYAALSRAADIPSTYPEVLAADDDDGNLANGTPNRCLIDAAFGPHGLVAGAGFGVTPPTRDGFALTVGVTSSVGCPAPDVDRVTVTWRVAGGADASFELTRTGTTFAGALPTQADGTVVEYQVEAALASGSSVRFPDNPGDPYYQFYVGPLVPVYCTDFETDPFAAGWTHAATSANDDWQWGPPAPTGTSGDPTAAASGSNLVGQDLRGDGRYARNSIEQLSSPVIDVAGYQGVRLQFKRWLTVEDGFYDKATIVANATTVWSNHASASVDASTHSLDREWRDQDVDLAAAITGDTVQVHFTLASDEGLEFGGWNLDDFCIMARTGGPLAGVCGDGTVDTGEACDDGNTASGDGCSATCTVEPGEDGGGCCSTGAEPRGALLLGLATGLVALRRRRRA
ncbi:MAG: hypothetical protein R3B06_01515 [Kofleriaceae bacterium]